MKATVQSPLDQVPEGAELAADLMGDQGRTLMKQGTELTADKLSALAKRGVQRVQIYCEEELDADALEARQAEITQRVEQRFSQTADTPDILRLKEIILEYRLEVLR